MREDGEPPSIGVDLRRGGPAEVSTPARIGHGALRVLPEAILGAIPVVGDALAAVVAEVERQRSESRPTNSCGTFHTQSVPSKTTNFTWRT